MPALWWTNIASGETTQHPSCHYWLITNPTCFYTCKSIVKEFIFSIFDNGFFLQVCTSFNITEIEVSSKISGYRALVVRASLQEDLGLQRFASFALDGSGTKLEAGPHRGSIRALAPRASSR